MEIRRPIAAVFAALTLFGGGATMTACQAAGQDQNDGSTDSDVSPSEDSSDDLPDNSDQDQGNTEDQNDDTQDPD
jgi:hypothetical protein